MEFLKSFILILALLTTNTYAIEWSDNYSSIKEVNFQEKPEGYVKDKGIIEGDLIYGDEWDNAVAPFTYTSGLILLGGAVASYLIYRDDFLPKSNREEGRRDAKDENWTQAGDFVGWGVLPLTYVAIMGSNYYFNDGGDQSLYKIEYMTKTILYTGLSTLALKLLVTQRRPEDRSRGDSFPSGHASSAFAFSTGIWMLHGPYWGAAATAAATWISYSRIYDGSHYWHDTVFGAALGTAVAYGIYQNHYNRGLPFSFFAYPTDGGGHASMNFKF